jgi:hypothetical protein
MGLLKWKCHGHPVRAAIYLFKTKDIHIIDDLKTLLDHYTNDHMIILNREKECEELEAMEAYDKFYNAKQWLEHGSFDSETGLMMLDNRCLVFTYDNAQYSNVPNEDDPGELLRMQRHPLITENF